MDELINRSAGSDRLRATKLLDELLTLFQLYRQDYNVVEDALYFIVATKEAYPEFQLTASLADYMRERGLIK